MKYYTAGQGKIEIVDENNSVVGSIINYGDGKQIMSKEGGVDRVDVQRDFADHQALDRIFVALK